MAHRYSRVLFVLGALLLACAAPAVAGIPSAANSIVPPRFVSCPFGDVQFSIVVRDIANFPVANCLVELDFSNCPGVAFCPGQELRLTWNPTTRRASKMADANGVALFYMLAGGVCPGVSIPVLASGINIGSGNAVASPDQDGNLLVNGADVTIVNGLLGTASLQADFDGDGLVEADDLEFVTNQHPAHSCDARVPARTPSWGTLKQIYR